VTLKDQYGVFYLYEDYNGWSCIHPDRLLQLMPSQYSTVLAVELSCTRLQELDCLKICWHEYQAHLSPWVRDLPTWKLAALYQGSWLLSVRASVY